MKLKKPCDGPNVVIHVSRTTLEWFYDNFVDTGRCFWHYFDNFVFSVLCRGACVSA